MCVIFIADKKRPTEDMITKGYETNPSGAGIAWRETKDTVQWAKGLDLEEVQLLAAKVPMPFVVHFRIPTCGGDRPSLCHPFPVDVNSTLALEGTTKGFVLFHNGHWSKWRESMLETLIRKGVKMPSGKWSDSRAMAWTAAHYDINVLELIDEKSVVISPTQIEIFGTGWTQANDCYVSNTHWQYRTGNRYVGQMCKTRTCTKTRVGTTDYCGDCLAIENGRKEAEKKAKDTEFAEAARVRVPEVAQPGKELTFRDGAETEGAGAAVKQEVQKGPAALRGGAEEGEEEGEELQGIIINPHNPSRDAPLNTLSEMWHWARRINKPDTKALTLAERQALRDKGIEVLGSM